MSKLANLGGFLGSPPDHPQRVLGDALIANGNELENYELPNFKNPNREQCIEKARELILDSEIRCLIGYSLSCLSISLAAEEMRKCGELDPNSPPLQKLILINPVLLPRLGRIPGYQSLEPFYPQGSTRVKPSFPDSMPIFDLNLQGLSCEKPICVYSPDDPLCPADVIMTAREKMRDNQTLEEPLNWIAAPKGVKHFNQDSDPTALRKLTSQLVAIINIDPFDV